MKTEIKLTIPIRVLQGNHAVCTEGEQKVVYLKRKVDGVTKCFARITTQTVVTKSSYTIHEKHSKGKSMNLRIVGPLRNPIAGLIDASRITIIR